MNSATPLRRRSLKFETPSSVGGDVDDEDLERGYGPSLFRAGESSLPVLLAQLPPVTFYSDLNKLFEFFYCLWDKVAESMDLVLFFSLFRWQVSPPIALRT